MGPTVGSIVGGCTSEPLSLLTELSILNFLATGRSHIGFVRLLSLSNLRLLSQRFKVSLLEVSPPNEWL